LEKILLLIRILNALPCHVNTTHQRIVMAIIPHGGPILTTTTDHMQVIIHVEVKWRPNNVEIFQNLISDSLYYLLLLTKNKIDQNQQHEENGCKR